MGLRLPFIEVGVDGCRVKLLLPCSRVEEMYLDPLIAELEATKGLRARAWRRLAEVFNVREGPPRLRVVGGPLFMVHQNFIAGGAFSSMPMFLRYDGERFIAEFHRPVVAVSPYVYYFEGVACGWTRPVLLSALIHEYAHIAFLQGGRLGLEVVRRMCLDARLAMQLPFLDDDDVRLVRDRGEEVDVLAEVPALWAERLLMESMGLDDHVESRLRLQEARDEELRGLMRRHGIEVAGPTAKWRAELLRRHLKRLGSATLADVEAYVEDEAERILGGALDKIRRGVEVEVRNDVVEAPIVMGRTVERLAAWREFLRRAFGYVDELP